MLVFHIFQDGDKSPERLCEPPRSPHDETLLWKDFLRWYRSHFNSRQSIWSRLFATGWIHRFAIIFSPWDKLLQQGAFRNLQAYNQLVSGFVSSVKKHKMGINYIVLEKVTENERSVCYTVDYNRGKWYCSLRTLRWMYGWTTAGQQECWSYIASVLFYIEAWNRVNEKLLCTQVKCCRLTPTTVKEVPSAPVSDIDFWSAKKLKQNLDQLSTVWQQAKELQTTGRQWKF